MKAICQATPLRNEVTQWSDSCLWNNAGGADTIEPVTDKTTQGEALNIFIGKPSQELAEIWWSASDQQSENTSILFSEGEVLRNSKNKLSLQIRLYYTSPRSETFNSLTRREKLSQVLELFSEHHRTGQFTQFILWFSCVYNFSPTSWRGQCNSENLENLRQYFNF